MIKTVKDLKDALAQFDDDMPVVIRSNESGGSYSDWKLHDPSEFYPGGQICLSAFERVSDAETAESASI